MTEARRVETTQELLDLANLAEMRPYEYGGRATGPQTDDLGEPVFNIGFAESFTGEVLENRFRFTVETNDAEYVADIAAIFEFDEPVDVPEDIRIDFAERVGFMATFPFLRESLITSAARLGKRGPLVGLMRPGDFRVEREQDEGSSDLSDRESGE